MRLAIFAVLAGAALVFAAWLHTDRFAPASQAGSAASPFFPRVAEPKPIPEMLFVDGAGQARSLAEFQGRLVLLNIWATWCAPCREEMPALDRLQAALPHSDFKVLALSIDQQGMEAVQRFYAETGIKALQLYVDPSTQAASRLRAIGIPTTLLVDRSGREIGRYTGAAAWDAPHFIEDIRRRISDESAAKR
jgi:thiol-disulfide isomerase/thioredoxin